MPVSPYPRTEADLLVLLRKHHKPARTRHELTESTARRFCAYVEAQTNYEANSTRDWTDLFVEGFPGFKTTRHVDDWLDNYQDADDEDYGNFIKLIKNFLR